MVRNAVTVALFAFGFGITYAQTDDAPVTDCDTYAANSLDSQRKAPSVNLIELNPTLAVPACESALQKYPDSAGLMYQLGRGYHRSDNLATAALWYGKAMEHGSAFGEAALALLYMTGQGVPKDMSKAADMTRDAAEKGVVIAQNALAYRYANGIGVAKNTNQALVWNRKAAQQGAPNPGSASASPMRKAPA